MNLKENKFTDFLKKFNIECFEKDKKDKENVVVFRTFMEIDRQDLPLIVVIDDSIYTSIRVQISSKTIKKENMGKMLSHINELNSKYKLFKYFITEMGDLCLDSCVVATEEEFNPEIIYTVINVILKHLEENYSTFMKIIWSES